MDLSKKAKEGGEVLLPCDETCEIYKKERREADMKLAEEKKKRKQEKETQTTTALAKRHGGTAKKKQERTSRKWRDDDQKDKSGLGIYFLLLLGMIATLCIVMLYFFS